MARLYLLAATLNAWVFLLVLAGAFGVQLIVGDLPCPLCVVQRIALMLCALGSLHILINHRGGTLTRSHVATGCGIAIVAALIGATAAGRQMLLHIMPGDQGFGSPVLGLHLYTWCLIVFICQVAASGLMLLAIARLKEERTGPWWPTGITVVIFAAMVGGNLLSVIAEAGLNWELPPDPVEYLLFK
jgi:disulfide bond formation protein DsbB